jgi:hypothetical protein
MVVVYGIATHVLAAWVASGGPGAARPDPAAVRDAVAALVADPPPRTITNDKHYLVSNERRLDLFAPDVRDVGGVHVGVGSDPNYVLAGWARSSLVVVVDFDDDVVDLHAIHGLFLAVASDGRSYRDLWTEDAADRAETLLGLRFPSPLIRARMIALYRRARPDVLDRLDVLSVKLAMAGETWFLDEDDDFSHVAHLAASGRVLAIRGDFTAPGVVRVLGDVLHEHGARVGTLYLSNIEQYFMYGPDYRANMSNLPLDEASIVLRTLPGRPAGFEYIVQRGDNFRRWLDSKRARSVYRMRGLSRGEHLTASQSFVIEREPPPGARRRGGS